MKVGVLALQGAFREHAEALDALGADAVEVAHARASSPASTRWSCPAASRRRCRKLLDSSGLRDAARRARCADGLPGARHVRRA